MNVFHLVPIGPGYNIGNFAISFSVRAWLKRVFGVGVNIITIPATGMDKKACGLTRRVVHNINQYGDLVVVGGGNLYENNELEVDLQALDALDVPLMLFSISRGRIFGRSGELQERTDVMPDRILRALHDKAVVGVARDIATQSHLESIGVTNSLMGGCPTLFMPQWLPDVGAADLTAAPCLISIRHPELMNIPVRRQAEVPELVRDLVALCRRSGYEDVRLLCHDHRDFPFAYSIPDVEYMYTSDVHDYLSWIQRAALVVSFRVHATIPAISLGRPVVNISYDERSLSLMEGLGLQAWDVPFMQAGSIVDEVADRIGRIDTLDGLRASLQPKWDSLWSVQQEAWRRVERAVQEPTGSGA